MMMSAFSWLIAICLAQVVGAIAYFVYGRGVRPAA
jgi:hypothetical protein